jgi:hypothetical protein
MDEIKDRQEEFLEEFRLLTEKYKIKHVIFGGIVEDRLWGFTGLYPIKSLSEFTECVTVAARIYQSAREKIFSFLDKMAK